MSDLKRPPTSPTAAPPSKKVMSFEAAPVGTPVTQLLIRRLSDDATIPTRGSALAAGYDIYASAPKVIPGKGGRAVVATDIALACPEGTYARVAPRSGLAVKHGIQTGAGVVDADYRGMVGILLFNHGEEDFQVNKGDRIAQFVLERIVTPEVIEVKALPETARGAGGFGSTGGFGPQLVAASTTSTATATAAPPEPAA